MLIMIPCLKFNNICISQETWNIRLHVMCRKLGKMLGKLWVCVILDCMYTASDYPILN